MPPPRLPFILALTAALLVSLAAARAGYTCPGGAIDPTSDGLEAAAGNTSDDTETAGRTQAVVGVVLDPSGAAIGQAEVRLLKVDGTVVAQAVTDPAGAFHFASVEFGGYRIEARAAGFRTAQVDIKIAAKMPGAVRISLAIATQNEVVNVGSDISSTSVSTEVSENQSSNSLDRDALDRVPVFDQDYISLMSRFLDDNAIGTSGVSLVVNGIEANGPGVSPSAVQEVKINQNPYSARYARPGRARLEITTKSGTPQLHGTVNFLFRDAVFDAKNAFLQPGSPKPPEQRRFYEGSLTGPLGRNKANTFLFSLERDEDNLQAIIDPAAIAAAASSGLGVIAGNIATPTRHFFIAPRFFHDFKNGDQFWIGYSFEDETQTNQGVGGLTLPSAAFTNRSREQEINVSYRKIFSPRWVNQLRFLIGHNDEPKISVSAAPQILVPGVFTAGGAQGNSKRTEAHVDGTDFVSYSGGIHQLVFGVDIPDISRRGADDFTNQTGTYVFPNLAAYASATPSSFTVQTGQGHLVFWERVVSGFIEDTVRVKPGLSMSFGVRYYYQNYFHAQLNHFAPRFGFAYAPSRKSKYVFRSGAGVFYDRTGPRPIADLLHFDGTHLLRLIARNPSYPVTPVELAALPIGIATLDPRMRMPYTVQYSFGVERQVTAKSTFSATYVGSRGIDLFRSRDINAPTPSSNYLTRPNPNFGQIRQIESEGYQKNNSLEMTFRGKPTKRLAGQAQYTLGKTYNNTSGITYFPGNSYFPWLDWGRADNDRRNKFDLLGSFDAYELFSFGVGLSAYSGKPVNVTTGSDVYGDALYKSRPTILGGSDVLPRNSLRGPGMLSLDLNVQRDFAFSKKQKEGPKLTIGLDAFNVLNHVNYVSFVGTLGCVTFPCPAGTAVASSFGLPAEAMAGRRMELTAEFKF
jgi:hypothetical protein